MLERLLMKQANKTTGKNVFCIWNFKETKPVDFWPGAIYCLTPLLTFTAKLSWYGLMLLLAWWIHIVWGAWAHFCFASNLQSNVFTINTCRVWAQVAHFRWEEVRDGLREQGGGQRRHTQTARGSRQGAAVMYTHTYAQRCSCSYTRGYTDAFLSPLNSP